MATNRKYESGKQLAVACTAPATPSSGDPVLFGQRPGVALTDEDAAGLTTVQFDGVFDLSVQPSTTAATAPCRPATSSTTRPGRPRS
jgi:predicted RecA/RadA family phage recombinase